MAQKNIGTLLDSFGSVKSLFDYGATVYQLTGDEIVGLFASFEAAYEPHAATYDEITRSSDYLASNGVAEMYSSPYCLARYRTLAKKVAPMNASVLGWMGANRLLMTRLCHDIGTDLDGMKQITLFLVYEQGLAMAQVNWERELRPLVESEAPITHPIAMNQLRDFCIESYNGIVSVRKLLTMSIVDAVSYNSFRLKHLRSVLQLHYTCEAINKEEFIQKGERLEERKVLRAAQRDSLGRAADDLLTALQGLRDRLQEEGAPEEPQ